MEAVLDVLLRSRAGNVGFEGLSEERRVLCNVLESPVPPVSCRFVIVSVVRDLLVRYPLKRAVIVEAKVTSMYDVVCLCVARKLIQLA